MGNIRNYVYDKLDFKLSDSEYYDFYLNMDGLDGESQLSGSTMISFNFSGFTSLAQSGITNEVVWDEANISISGITASTYGLTGLDNGSIFYDPTSDDFGHTTLISLLSNTSLVYSSGDTSLVLKQVTGYTGNYEYPIDLTISTGSTGNYLNLCGGFYQGYYKLDGYDYEVLPSRYQDGWTVESWLKPSDLACSGHTGTTLNTTYPDNKGMFFYSGTRAENKFWTVFSGNTLSACTSGSTDFCTDIKETDIMITNVIVGGVVTNITIPLSPPPVDVSLITNQFLIYGRSNGKLCEGGSSEDGFGRQWASKYDENTPFYSSIVRTEITDFRNPFLIYGRSNGKLCEGGSSEDGYGRMWASKYSGATSPILELDKDEDIIDNAIGFRITDDGSIGYRMLKLSADCKNVEVVEEYSLSGLVASDQWQHIVVKWTNDDTYTDCDLEVGEARKGKYKFYVNSYLIFVSKSVDEFIPKRLHDIQEKQVGVPYNISIGGGTQGLLESMTFDGQDADDLGLVIEQNFAGSFIGSISTFKLHDNNLSWCEIKNIYNSTKNIYI